MSKTQKGFSLIEILLVVTIIGIISVISIPWLQKAISVEENTEAYSSLSAVSSMQVSYYAKHNRFGRLDELHAEIGDTLGTLTDSKIQRGEFTLTLNSPNPTDSDLVMDYQILATKKITNSDTPCVLLLESSGAITEVFGDNCFTDNQ